MPWVKGTGRKQKENGVSGTLPFQTVKFPSGLLQEWLACTKQGLILMSWALKGQENSSAEPCAGFIHSAWSEQSRFGFPTTTIYF